MNNEQADLLPDLRASVDAVKELLARLSEVQGRCFMSDEEKQYEIGKVEDAMWPEADKLRDILGQLCSKRRAASLAAEHDPDARRKALTEEMAERNNTGANLVRIAPRIPTIRISR
jgi:hypothetical protein